MLIKNNTKSKKNKKGITHRKAIRKIIKVPKKENNFKITPEEKPILRSFHIYRGTNEKVKSLRKRTGKRQVKILKEAIDIYEQIFEEQEKGTAGGGR